MKVFLLSELVPKEVKENIIELSSNNIIEMKLYNSYSVLSINSIPEILSDEIIKIYKIYLLEDIYIQEKSGKIRVIYKNFNL